MFVTENESYGASDGGHGVLEIEDIRDSVGDVCEREEGEVCSREPTEQEERELAVSLVVPVEHIRHGWNG